MRSSTSAALSLVFLIMFDGCVARAQSPREPAPVSDKVQLDRTASTSDKIKTWTRARWNAARKHWADDNAKFYGCSHKWRVSNQGARYRFHEQREFIFSCMNAA